MLAIKVEVNCESYYSGRRDAKDAKQGSGSVSGLSGEPNTCCFQLLAYTLLYNLPFGRIFRFHDGGPFLLLCARLACILHLARRRKGCPGAARATGVSCWREDPRELLKQDHVCLRDSLVEYD